MALLNIVKPISWALEGLRKKVVKPGNRLKMSFKMSIGGAILDKTFSFMLNLFF